jgi:phage gp46-like protein
MKNDLQNFEGDLLLSETPDGGDVSVLEGLFQSDRSFSTAVYLSLFGGNKADGGKVKNKHTWWGNTLRNVNENEKMISRFQALIHGMPMTTKTIQDAEAAAALDLQWIVDEKIADKVSASGKAVSRNRFVLSVKISAGGNDLYTNSFALFWKAGVYGV